MFFFANIRSPAFSILAYMTVTNKFVFSGIGFNLNFFLLLLQALGSFGLMVLSSIVAAWADIQIPISYYSWAPKESATIFSVLGAGYIWMCFNCISSATYLLAMRKRLRLTNFSDFETMYFNNILSIPILLVCSILLEDWSAANLIQNFPPNSRIQLFIAIFLSGFSSLAISYCSIWCIHDTSSTSYSMAGAFNK